MKRRAVSRSTVIAAGFVALVYSSLAAMAASCAMSPVDPAGGHAHHGSQEAAPYNALCSWACQATSDAGPAIEPPPLSTDLVVRMMISSHLPLILSRASSQLHSRAPPSIPLVHIG